MNDFEKQIGKTFPALRERDKADLMFLYPPMRIVGMSGRMPCHIPSGKAPYDIGGHYIGSGVAIGVELKQTAKHENAISIVLPEGKGSGLMHHQLEALMALHDSGGAAFLLWNNGGEIGRLGGQGLKLVKVAYDASLKSRNPAKGSRSIKWGMFAPVKLGINDLPLWLPEWKGKS